MDLKKEKLTQLHFYINQFLTILAHRFKIDLITLEFLHWNELDDLINGKQDIKVLNDRKKRSSFLIYKGGVDIFTKEVAQIRNHVFLDSDITEFSGITASVGNMIAEAVVLNSVSDISKMVEGKILVTGMTTPEFLPAMKLASAIITNEGGITSHAAIVARELGIPCVVGTQIATKAIHDGDLIELHGASGTIKIRRWKRVI